MGTKLCTVLQLIEAFPDMVSDNGGVRVVLPLTDDYCYDLDAMLAAITDKTKMVIVCNPNNPTGTYVNSAKVEEFIRKLPDHVIPVVDEAYFEYVEDPTHYSLIKMIQEATTDLFLYCVLLQNLWHGRSPHRLHLC